jgi:Zinc-finger of C2H2 type
MSNYYCDVCNYSTNNKGSYNTHLNSKKHVVNLEQHLKDTDKNMFDIDEIAEEHVEIKLILDSITTILEEIHRTVPNMPKNQQARVIVENTYDLYSKLFDKDT